MVIITVLGIFLAAIAFSSNTFAEQTVPEIKTVKIYPVAPLPPASMDKYALKCGTTTLTTTCPAGTTKITAVAAGTPTAVISATKNNDHEAMNLATNQLPQGATGITLKAFAVAKKTSANPTKFSISFAKGGDGGTTPVFSDLPKAGFSLTNSYAAYTRDLSTTDPFGGSWTLTKVNQWIEPDGKKIRAGVDHLTDAKEGVVNEFYVEATFTRPVPTISISASPTTAPPGATITVTGTATGQYFTDIARIDWGDSTTTDAPINFATGAFSATHQYSSGGTYDVTAKLITVGEPDPRKTSNTQTITIIANTELQNLSITPSSLPWGQSATASVTLINSDTGDPIEGETVTFSGDALDGSYDAVTDSNGVASTQVTTASAVGTLQINADYAGSTSYNAAAQVSTDVTLEKHQPKFEPGSFTILGVASEDNPSFAFGKIIDTDDNNKSISGLDVTITSSGSNAYPPATTGRTQVIDTDLPGSSVGGEITVNEGAQITFPYDPTSVTLKLNVGNGLLEFDYVYNDPANPGATTTYSAQHNGEYMQATVSAGQITPILPNGNGIKSITFVTLPGGTVGITYITTDIDAKVLQELTPADLLVDEDGKVIDGTIGDAIFGAPSTFEVGETTLTASSAETSLYKASLDDADDTTQVSVEAGGLGSGSGVSFNGKIFLGSSCGDNAFGISDDTSIDDLNDPDTNTSPDDDGDFICDRFEKSGIPFRIDNYQAGTSTIVSRPLDEAGNKDVKDIYVEQDYMTSGSSTHKLLPSAETKIKAVFAALSNPVTLHIISSDAIPEPDLDLATAGVQTYTTMFTDTNTRFDDDFNSIKSKYLGFPSDRVDVSFTNGANSVFTEGVCSGSNIPITISGIKITTPGNAIGNDGNDISGTMALTFKLTHPLNAAITIPTISAPPANGIYTGTATSRIDTVSTTVKTINVFIPFSVTSQLTQVTFPSVIVTLSYSGCDAANISEANLPTDVASITSQQVALAKVEHYFLNAHSPALCVNALTSPLSSGRSEMPGNDISMTLGCGPFALDAFGHRVGNDDEQAGTFGHEAGHNLNMNHGGPDKLIVAEDGVVAGGYPPDRTDNCKPNELSIMSYSRQTPWKMGASFNLGYSNGQAPNIDEAALLECNAGYPAIASPNAFVWFNPAVATNQLGLDNFDGGPIDWNRDTVTNACAATVAVDTNDFNIFNCDNSIPGAVGAKIFKAYNEPANFNYNFKVTISGYSDAGSFTDPSYAFSYSDTTLGAAQGAIRDAVMYGFVPPPEPDGTSVRNYGSATPLKVVVLGPDGTLITYGEGFADVTKGIDTNNDNILDSVVPTSDSPIGPFVFGTLHHDYTWHSNDGVGTYYLTFYMIVPGTDPPEKVVMFSSDPNHPILHDAAGNRVTGIITFN